MIQNRNTFHVYAFIVKDWQFHGSTQNRNHILLPKNLSFEQYNGFINYPNTNQKRFNWIFIYEQAMSRNAIFINAMHWNNFEIREIQVWWVYNFRMHSVVQIVAFTQHVSVIFKGKTWSKRTVRKIHLNVFLVRNSLGCVFFMLRIESCFVISISISLSSEENSWYQYLVDIMIFSKIILYQSQYHYFLSCFSKDWICNFPNSVFLYSSSPLLRKKNSFISIFSTDNNPTFFIKSQIIFVIYARNSFSINACKITVCHIVWLLLLLFVSVALLK